MSFKHAIIFPGTLYRTIYRWCCWEEDSIFQLGDFWCKWFAKASLIPFHGGICKNSSWYSTSIKEPSKGMNSTLYFNNRTLFQNMPFSYFQVLSATLVLLRTSGPLGAWTSWETVLPRLCKHVVTPVLEYQHTERSILLHISTQERSFWPGMISGVLAKHSQVCGQREMCD